MSLLFDFLLENSVEDLQENVIVSPRLADYPFSIKGVTAKEIHGYSRSCTKKSDRQNVFDGEKFNLLLILNHCVEPDFRDAKALEKAGCTTPEALVNKTLKAGEIGALAKAIYRLSGYDQTMKDLKDTVKN
ncbi:MAG: hypothetical protein RSB05_01005 [Clostridiales bacterium]